MDNTQQKNVIYKNASLNVLPYQSPDCLKIGESQNVNDVRMNNIFRQLVNNDLYIENRCNTLANYSVGPSDKAGLSSSVDGYKCYDDEGLADLSILHRVDRPVQATLREETNFCQDLSFRDSEIYGIFRTGDYTVVLSQNGVFYRTGDECWYPCTVKGSSGSIAATCHYSDDSRIFLGCQSGVYQMVMTQDSQQLDIVYLVKISGSSISGVTSVHFQPETGKIIAGTSGGSVMYGYFAKDEQEVEFVVMGEFVDLQYKSKSETAEFITPGKVTSVHTLGYDKYVSDVNSVVVGTQNGLFRARKAQSLSEYRKYSLSDWGVLSAIGAVCIHDSIHIIAADGIYCVSDGMGSVQKKCDVQGICGFQACGSELLFWKGSVVYSYYYSQADFTYQSLIAIAGDIGYANTMSVGSLSTLIVASGGTVSVYDRSTQQKVRDIYTAGDDIRCLQVNDAGKRIMFITDDTLYKTEITGSSVEVVEKIDNLEKFADGGFQQVVVCDDLAEERVCLFATDGVGVYQITGSQCMRLGIDNAERIVDFDAAYVRTGTGDGETTHIYVAYLTASGAYVFDCTDSSSTELLAFAGETPASIIHSGHYFAILAGSGDDCSVYTVDMQNDMSVQKRGCTGLTELHNCEFDNSVIYGLSGSAVAKLSVETTCELKDTGVSAFGRRIFKSTDSNTKMFASDENGLSTYVLTSDDDDKCELCTVVSGMKDAVYIDGVFSDKYVACGRSGVQVRSMSDDSLVSSLFQLSSDGACIWNEQEAKGCYSIERRLSCIGDQQIQYEYYVAAQANSGNMLAISSDGTNSRYITTDSPTDVVIFDGVSKKTQSVDGNIIGMSKVSSGGFLVATGSHIYVGDDGDSGSFLTCTGISPTGQFGYFAPCTGYDHAWNLVTHGNEILYAGDIQQQTVFSDMQQLLSVKLDDGDGGIRSFSIFNVCQDDAVVPYVVFNSDFRIFYRKLLSTDGGGLEAAASDIEGLVDNQLGTDYGMSVVNSYVEQQGEFVRYSALRDADGNVSVFRNEQRYSSMTYKGLTYSVKSQYVVDTDGASINTLALNDDCVYQNGQVYSVPGKTTVSLAFVSNGPIYAVNTDGIVKITSASNQTYGLDSVIIDGYQTAVTDAGSVFSITQDESQYLVACVNGVLCQILVSDSDFSLNESSQLKSVPGCDPFVKEARYNGQFLYTVRAGTDGSSVISRYGISVGDDGCLSAEFDREYSVAAGYSLASVFNVQTLVDTVDGSGEIFADSQKNLYETVTYNAFSNPVVAYSGSNVTCAAWNNDESNAVGRGCYFLDDAYTMFRLDEQSKRETVYDFDEQFGIRPTSMRLAGGVAFLMQDSAQYYVKDGQSFTFSGGYPSILGAETLSGRYNYVFGSALDGLYRNADYSQPVIWFGECSMYGNSQCGEFTSILNNRGNSECVVRGASSAGQMSLTLDYSADELVVQAIGGVQAWHAMAFVDDTTSPERRFLQESSGDGISFYDGQQIASVPRFSLDSRLGEVKSALYFDGSYFLLLPDTLVRFSGWTQTGIQFRRVGSKSNSVNQIYAVSDSRFMTASGDGQYYFQYRNGDLTVPVRTNSDTQSIRQITSATYGEKTWYLCVKDNAVYYSDNCLSWKDFLDTMESHKCVLFIGYNRYLIGTSKGVYSTDSEYTVRNDFYKFREQDIYGLYKGMQETLSELYADKYEEHISDHEYGHGSDSILDKIQDPDTGLMDVAFTNFSDGDSDWQTETQESSGVGSTRRVMNDIVQEVVFGDQDTGDITVNSSNFLTSSVNQAFTYIKKRWMSGLIEIYVYIPTTNTYYINHVYGAPNCSQYDVEATRKNLQRFGQAKAKITGDMSTHYTSFEVRLDNVAYTVDSLLGVQANGNSLPLKIYKDSEYEDIEGQASTMFHSFIQPTLNTLNEINNGSVTETEHIFKFACFGSDAQAVKLQFYDKASKTGGKTFKLVFNSNGASTSTVKQLVPMDQSRYVTLKANTFKWVQSVKEFVGWSFTPSPQEGQTPDLTDRQQFSYTCKPNGYIPENIYRGIKSGSTVNLYAIWTSVTTTEDDTTLTLKSNGEQFYISSVEIDPTTSLGNKVIINYEG